jgi:predicted flap endonuclease-1-like 5' DNA nuclease
VVKVVGILGGVAALIWAMRDRFVSVAVSREPVPPAFKVGDRRPGPGPVDQIEGIGPVFAQRLASAGIGDIATLARSSPDAVAEAAGVSAARARTWIGHASNWPG